VPSISVVIPSYNHPDQIRQCVHSVLRQEYTGTVEIVVVDSSPAAVQQRVADRLEGLPNLKLIRLDRQTFPGTARNVGVEHASGELIAFIDADCRAEAGWLATISENLRPGTMLAGVILNGTPESGTGTSSYLVEFNEFLPFVGKQREIAAAPTCNLAVYRNEFMDLGGFTDDRAFEDFLFCNHFRDAGGRIIQLNALRIRHMNKTELTDIVRNQHLLGRHSAIVRRKHGLPPRAVFRNPRLAYALAPYRFFRILRRVSSAGQLGPFLRNLRTIIHLLREWSVGFHAGAQDSAPRTPQPQSRTRHLTPDNQL
jgi:glycosyltransferase involved in cell wall biosynthesis